MPASRAQCANYLNNTVTQRSSLHMLASFPEAFSEPQAHSEEEVKIIVRKGKGKNRILLAKHFQKHPR